MQTVGGEIWIIVSDGVPDKAVPRKGERMLARELHSKRTIQLPVEAEAWRKIVAHQDIDRLVLTADNGRSLSLLQSMGLPLPDRVIDLDTCCNYLTGRHLYLHQIKGLSERAASVNVTFNSMKADISEDTGLQLGEYLKAVARIDHRGIPIDMDLFQILCDNSAELGRYMVMMAQEIGIPFADVEKAVNALRSANLNALRKGIDADGRNRSPLEPFGATTGRNAPSSTRYIFGQHKILRGLIRPKLGRGLAYLDYCQQEFGIAAALSGDKTMCEAYLSGDPYLGFGKAAGLMPVEATKSSCPEIRKKCKDIVLGIQYGQGPKSIAEKNGMPFGEAAKLCNSHHKVFSRFWRWLDDTVSWGKYEGFMLTPLNTWRYMLDLETPDGRLGNFPMQAAGAEIMRIVCCEAEAEGINICAVIHDGFLIEVEEEQLDNMTAKMIAIMERASLRVLQSLTCRVEAKTILYPQGFWGVGEDKLWTLVEEFIQQSLSMPIQLYPLYKH